MKRTWFGVLWLGALGLSSCREVQGTEVVFEFWTDLRADEVTRVHIQVVGVGEEDDPRSTNYDCRVEDDYEPGAQAGRSVIEFTYAVRPGDRCNRRVFLSAAVYVGRERIATGSASAEFKEGESQRAQVRIEAEDNCDPGVMWCYDGCSDGQFDVNNCGWCGNVCPEGASCRSGWCDCPEGWELCDDACVDVQKDPSNCGACGHACQPDQACKDGMCTGDCSPWTRCGQWCVDTQTDRRNCGACDNDCGELLCSGGVCNSACPPPRRGGDCDPIEQCNCGSEERCDAVENPYDDRSTEHCSRAGSAGAMEPCDEAAPATTCAPGLTCILSDPFVFGPGPSPGMGTCRKWCVVGDDSTCDEGFCAMLAGQVSYGVCYPYAEPETCNGVDDDGNGVVDDLGPNRDPFNCGFCGNYCESGICSDGGCLTRCEDAFLETCTDDTCHDSLWDRQSCGGCPHEGGVPCNATQTCHQGTCQGGTVGDPCEADLQCSGIGPAVGSCARDMRLPDGTRIPLPGGYCTQVCNPTGAGCPPGSQCIDPPGGRAPFCLKTCDPWSPSPEMECRPSQGYRCVRMEALGGSFCLPLGTIGEPVHGAR